MNVAGPISNVLARQPGAVRGALWAVIAAASFTGMPISVRLLSDTMSTFEIIFFRSLLGMTIMAPYFCWRGWGELRTAVPWIHFSRSAINFVGMVIWFYGLAVMPLAEAVAIHFTMPLFIVLLAALFLAERVGPRRWAATAIGFAGVLIVLRPGVAEVSLPAIGILISAALYGGAMVLIKKLTASESAAAIIFISHLIMLLLAAAPTAMLWHPPGWEDVPALLILSVCGTVAPYCVTRALRVMDASIVAPFDFLRLPFTALAGWLLFAEFVDQWTWLGAAVIFGATTYIARREAALERAGNAG